MNLQIIITLSLVFVAQAINSCSGGGGGGDEESFSTHHLSQLEHIDELIQEENDSNKAIITCKQYMNLHTFVDPVSVTNTLYQEISFSESTEKPDKCLTLDDTLQICNSYRPQYHEYFVHFPAAYLPKLQRALFVGGGDSMLLHELLKYPDLDLIIGLELDQQVVRQSLKHFYTQPHFDTPKVQWWFGDAATSLSLLPIEYYGTFDLVMVDLSETVMSASVTDQMDILHALSLLLHPEDGIFIKNERYMSELSNVFEHVMQIYLPDCPLICDQDWVLGSHGIDLLHPDFDRLLGKYNIQTFHYRPRETHFALIKDYAKNDISCMINHAKDEITTTSDEHNHENRTKHGIFIALEAEGAMRISQPDFILKEELLKALHRHTELRIRIVAPEYEEGGNHIFILMHEGYITTTCWADMQYCQADLRLLLPPTLIALGLTIFTQSFFLSRTSFDHRSSLIL